MNFNVSFPRNNEDSSLRNLSFLIGRNGSGKTTFISLLTAALTPSYILLNQIKFDEMSVYCENDYLESTTIKIKRTRETIWFQIQSKKEIFAEDFPAIPIDEHEEKFLDEKFNEECDYFGNSRTAKFIKEMGLFVTLDLSRKTQSDVFSLFKKKKNKPFYSRVLDSEDNGNDIDQALYRIQKNIDVEKNNISLDQARLSTDFYDKIIEESFAMTDIFNQEVPDLGNFDVQLRILESRKIKIQYLLQHVELKQSIKDSFQNFFAENETLLQKLKKQGDKKDPNDYAKWLIRCTQFGKIDRIIQYGQEYQNSMAEAKKHLTRLANAMDSFLKEGGKSVDLYGLNGVIVNLPKNQQNTIFNLSSGEKQIFIILANLVFSAKKNPKSVFVIDEPELSLHISWQELFVDALQTVSPETQFILATHSPSIIARRERQSCCIDLTKEV